MNKVVLIGRLTKDAELSYAPKTGLQIAKFTLAVDRRFSKENQKKEADFIPIVVFGNTAEALTTYTAKGKLISVSGRIQTRTYDDKEGSKRYITEIVADEVQFIEWASKGTTSNDGMTLDNTGGTPFDYENNF